MNKDLFSERLKALRKERGFNNPNQFADAYNKRFPPKRKDDAGGNEKSGILGTIKHYENPNYTKSMPSLDKVINMCELLGCDVDYLTGKLDFKTHNAKYVSEYTGLTETAIDVLHFLASSSGDEETHGYIISLINLVLENSYGAVDQYRRDEAEANRIIESTFPDLYIDENGEVSNISDRPIPEDISIPCSIPIENIFSTMYQFIKPQDTSLSFRDGENRITISGEAATLDSNGDSTLFTVNELKRTTLFERIRKQLTALSKEEK